VLVLLQAGLCHASASARLLLISLLIAGAVARAATPAPQPGKSGTELDKAVEANVEAQDFQEETAPVYAQIIKAESAALIASGTGDISTTGARPIQDAYGALQP
jgi:hypothetical protein